MSSLRRCYTLMLASTLFAGLALLPAVGCTATADPVGDVDDTETSGISFEEWKESVYQEPETGIWIVNGDVPIDNERELHEFFMNHVQQGALVVHQVNGADSKWDATQKLNITYCVSEGFGANYNAVVSAMTAATGAWEAAANVNFVHKTDQDGNCTAANTGVVFDVRPVSGQQYLARAFFPYQARSTRNVLIDSSSFGSIAPYTLTGILRHELGHTLGFRHEHTRPEAGKCFEDSSYRPLTDYDSQSVMHYPQCNGTQTGDLVLTDKDKAGVASLYGAPGAQPPGGGGGGTTTCEHDKCAAGSKLTSSCDACVQKIAAADPYCVNTLWDSQCVGEVKTVCNEACGTTAACVHDKCVTGAVLTGGCDACVQKVIAADSYCGTTGWDSVCVSAVNDLCGAGTCQ